MKKIFITILSFFGLGCAFNNRPWTNVSETRLLNNTEKLVASEINSFITDMGYKSCDGFNSITINFGSSTKNQVGAYYNSSKDIYIAQELPLVAQLRVLTHELLHHFQHCSNLPLGEVVKDNNDVIIHDEHHPQGWLSTGLSPEADATIFNEIFKKVINNDTIYKNYVK